MAGKRKSGQGATPKPKVIKAGAAEFAHVRQITDWFLGMMVNGTGFFESHLICTVSCFQGCATL